MLWIRKFLTIVSIGMLSMSSVWAQKLPNLDHTSWFDFEKEYVKISVENDGIHKILFTELPDNFKQNKSQLELWWKGQIVPLVRIDDDGILFFGIKSTGESDSLVYRPYSARLNPYENLYSDKSAYFLSIGNKGKAIQSVNGKSLTGEAQPYHIKREIKTFRNQFGFTSIQNAGSNLNHSYYTEVNTWTGPSIVAQRPNAQSTLDTVMKFDIPVKSVYKTEELPISIEMLLTGLYTGAHNVRLQVGNSESSLREVGSSKFNGWESLVAKHGLKIEDVNQATNKLYVKLFSDTKNLYDWFGLSYYKVEYPQYPICDNQSNQFFTFPSTTQALTRIKISNIKGSPKFYDISNPENIILLEGNLNGETWEAMVGRNKGKELRIYVSYTETLVEKSFIQSTSLKPLFTYSQGTVTKRELIDGRQFNYFIVTNATLSKSAIEYAKYRSSTSGGNYKTIVVDIKDIYDLYNFGEISPVALKRFVSEVTKSVTDFSRHNLLLMGHSVTYPSLMRKDLPNEVPTIGDPGADILLVSGINGLAEDEPIMPVGRVRAFNDTEVLNYLNKVITYESEVAGLDWRKRILHLNGGMSYAEINSLKGILENLESVPTNSYLGAGVSKFIKTTVNTERIDISDEVNNGIGMLTYFGHGSQTITDLDFGYVSDITRRYSDSERYSFMYFNGCGVGNLFTSRTQHALSDDWIITGRKGAIAVMANSYLSYVSTSAKHIDALYKVMFNNRDYTIGQVHIQTAKNVLRNSPNEFDIANIHQVILQGDPAIKIFNLQLSDYAINAETGLVVYSENKENVIGKSDNGKLAIIPLNLGSYNSKELLGVNVTFEYASKKENKKLEIASPRYVGDTIWVPINEISNLKRIFVELTPTVNKEEINLFNNKSELLIDWDSIKDEYFYPSEPLADFVLPRTIIKVDGTTLSNRSKISPESVFQIELEDDRYLEKDKSLFSVFIKDCWTSNCNYEEIELSNVELVLASERLLLLNLAPQLPIGQYEILVRARDVAGNYTSGNGYTLQFEITDDRQHAISVYPNPASEYIAVDLSKLSIASRKSIGIRLLNMLGNIVLEDSDISKPIHYITGINTLAKGLYIIEVIDKESGSQTRTKIMLL